VNAKASHILISYEGTTVPNQKSRTKEEAKESRIYLAQVNANPDSFLMLAFKIDDSSAQQGGDLGYFGPNQMVKPFDFVFNTMVLEKSWFSRNRFWLPYYQKLQISKTFV
jgi:peptidyl-prolyl cis-trans isomerase D